MYTYMCVNFFLDKLLGPVCYLHKTLKILLAQSQRHGAIDRLEERGGHKAKDMAPSIAWRREAGTKPKT